MVVRKHPFSTICVPLMVLVVLVGLGVYGVLAGAASTANSNQSTAYSIVRDTSLSFTLYIEKVGAWGCARGGRCMGMCARREVHGDVCADGGGTGLCHSWECLVHACTHLTEESHGSGEGV